MGSLEMASSYSSSDEVSTDRFFLDCVTDDHPELVQVSVIVNYINQMANSESVQPSACMMMLANLKALVTGLDPENCDPMIDLQTFRVAFAAWVQNVQLKSEEVAPIIEGQESLNEVQISKTEDEELNTSSNNSNCSHSDDLGTDSSVAIDVFCDATSMSDDSEHHPDLRDEYSPLALPAADDNCYQPVHDVSIFSGSTVGSEINNNNSDVIAELQTSLASCQRKLCKQADEIAGWRRQVETGEEWVADLQNKNDQLKAINKNLELANERHTRSLREANQELDDLRVAAIALEQCKREREEECVRLKEACVRAREDVEEQKRHFAEVMIEKNILHGDLDRVYEQVRVLKEKQAESELKSSAQDAQFHEMTKQIDQMTRFTEELKQNNKYLLEEKAEIEKQLVEFQLGNSSLSMALPVLEEEEDDDEGGEKDDNDHVRKEESQAVSAQKVRLMSHSTPHFKNKRRNKESVCMELKSSLLSDSVHPSPLCSKEIKLLTSPVMYSISSSEGYDGGDGTTRGTHCTTGYTTSSGREDQGDGLATIDLNNNDSSEIKGLQLSSHIIDEVNSKSVDDIDQFEQKFLLELSKNEPVQAIEFICKPVLEALEEENRIHLLSTSFYVDSATQTQCMVDKIYVKPDVERQIMSTRMENKTFQTEDYWINAEDCETQTEEMEKMNLKDNEMQTVDIRIETCDAEIQTEGGYDDEDDGRKGRQIIDVKDCGVQTEDKWTTVSSTNHRSENQSDDSFQTSVNGPAIVAILVSAVMLILKLLLGNARVTLHHLQQPPI